LCAGDSGHDRGSQVEKGASGVLGDAVAE
jgi:hypothetical protein